MGQGQKTQGEWGGGWVGKGFAIEYTSSKIQVGGIGGFGRWEDGSQEPAGEAGDEGGTQTRDTAGDEV